MPGVTETEVSVITLAELTVGVLMANDADRPVRVATLSAVESTWDPLPIDAEVAREFARTVAVLRTNQRRVPILDALVAATAVVELAIDDVKEGVGLDHCPSGSFSANAAWMCCAVLSHNLIRWTAKLDEMIPEKEALVVARTLRTRYFSVPARLVNRKGVSIRNRSGPLEWPWRDRFLGALSNMRAIAFTGT